MKSKRVSLRAFKKNIKKVFKKKYTKYVLSLVVIFLIIYVSTKIFTTFFDISKQSFLGPKETMVVNLELESEIYFNNIVGEEGILDVIVEQIHSAEFSIELAVFSFVSQKIKKVLVDAVGRGVEVTLILDESKSGQHDLFLGDLPQEIKRIDRGTYDPVNSRRTTYMHHKFILTDRGFPQQKLATSSVNFTTLGEKYNQSFLLTTTDSSLISVYGKEFDFIKGGKYGRKKISNKEYNPWAASIQYQDSFVDVWFSPGYSKQSIKYEILEQISSAQVSIKIMMWHFTDNQLASALIRRAKDGVDVYLIIESGTAQEQYSVVPYLESVIEREKIDNFEIVFDTKLIEGFEDTLPEGFKPFIHHHSMVVDDAVVVFGSSNWSLWGFYYNDENNIVTNNRNIIDGYNKTFDYFYELFTS